MASDCRNKTNTSHTNADAAAGKRKKTSGFILICLTSALAHTVLSGETGAILQE